MSQPAGSARLSLLERRLGVTLLERGPSGSRPTAAGTLVAGWSADLLRAVETFESAARGLRRDVDSTLRVVASCTVAEYLLPCWLAELARRDPDVSSELGVANSRGVTEAVLAGRVDLGFVVAQPIIGRGGAPRSRRRSSLPRGCHERSGLGHS